MYLDRRDAGRSLAALLRAYAGPRAIVLGLTRGGVVVAAEVARELGAPLDVVIVRKLGAPGNQEYAIGAVAESAEPIVNTRELAVFGTDLADLQPTIARQRETIDRQKAIYRGGRGLPDLTDRTAILVDDGIATGYTMRAAIAAVRAAGAQRIVVAVPVGPAQTLDELHSQGVDVVCPQRPEPFLAVGLHYADFAPVEDDEVRQVLQGTARLTERERRRAA